MARIFVGIPFRQIRASNIMSFPYFSETEELTDSARAHAGGSFVQLSDGVCHYELHFPLPKSGEGKGARAIVVLIHGFSVPSFIWDPTFDFLRGSGFRVLRYDLFGRGLSDRPRVRYDIRLFTRQLKDLLDALDLREPVHLAGLSLGGPISAAFADQFPERVKTHILVDPAGARPVQLPAALKLLKVRGLGELGLGLLGNDSFASQIASDFYDPILVKHFIERYKPQMRIKGFRRAILSTIRSGMLESFHETYRRVGQLRKPTLLFWGRDDTTIPFADSGFIRAAIPHAEFHVIENCGHIPHYEKPETVNPILHQFLTTHA